MEVSDDSGLEKGYTHELIELDVEERRGYRGFYSKHGTNWVASSGHNACGLKH